MNKSHIQPFRRTVLISALGLALSGTAAAAGTLDWTGRVQLDGSPLSRSALSTSPSGVSLNTQGTLGIGIDADGWMQLSGPGAIWNHSGGALVVGGNSAHGGPGSGTLLIQSGARVTQTLGDVVIGQNLNGSSQAVSDTGSVLVSGAGSLLQIDGGNLLIGAGKGYEQGEGEMTIADQARVIVNATTDRLTGGQVTLGASSGSKGAAGQVGTLRILNGGLLSAENISRSGGNAKLTLDGGILTLTGTPQSDAQGTPQATTFLSGVTTTLGLKGATIDIEAPSGLYQWDSNSFIDMVKQSDPASQGLTKTGAGTLSLVAPFPSSTIVGDQPDVPLSRLAVRQGTLELKSLFFNSQLASSFPELDSTNNLDLGILELHSGATFRDISGPTPLGGPNQQLSLDGKQLLVVQHGQAPGALYQVGANKAQTLSAQNARLSFTTDALTPSALLDVQGSANISGSTVSYSLALPATQMFTSNTTQTLIETTGTLTADSIKPGELQGRAGSTVALDIALQQQGNRLLALIQGRANEGSKSLAEGALGGVITARGGADLAAGQGMDSARQATSGSDGFVGFGALSGGQLKDETGSHVDTDGVSTMIGIARGFRPAAGHLTTGIFAEYGHGSYDTYNSFATGALHGSGTADYAGGGVLARLDFGDPEQNHAFVEASLRAGQLDNDYRSDGLTNVLGQSARYDLSQTYYGAHIGLGYALRPAPRLGLELYDRLFWTHVQGASTTLSTGERFSLDDTDSQRNRLGARLTYQASEQFKPYVGLAWEHEFDGKMNATTNGYAIDAPSLEGDTGVAELGMRITPTAASRLTADLGVQGYSGRREGVTGSLRVRYLF